MADGDPMIELAKALGECHRWNRRAVEQIDRILLDLTNASARVHLRKVRNSLAALAPDVTLTLQKIESGSDPGRWFLTKE